LGAGGGDCHRGQMGFFFGILSLGGEIFFWPLYFAPGLGRGNNLQKKPPHVFLAGGGVFFFKLSRGNRLARLSVLKAGGQLSGLQQGRKGKGKGEKKKKKKH